MSLFLLILISCSNENSVESNSNKYLGSWRWIKTVGGFAPRVIVPKDGVTTKLIFESNISLKILRNDTLKVFAFYKIEGSENGRDKISYTNVQTFGYTFDREYEYLEIHTDTLVIWDGIYDGYFRFYIKDK